MPLSEIINRFVDAPYPKNIQFSFPNSPNRLETPNRPAQIDTKSVLDANGVNPVWLGERTQQNIRALCGEIYTNEILLAEKLGILQIRVSVQAISLLHELLLYKIHPRWTAMPKDLPSHQTNHFVIDVVIDMGGQQYHIAKGNERYPILLQVKNQDNHNRRHVGTPASVFGHGNCVFYSEFHQATIDALKNAVSGHLNQVLQQGKFKYIQELSESYQHPTSPLFDTRCTVLMASWMLDIIFIKLIMKFIQKLIDILRSLDECTKTSNAINQDILMQLLMRDFPEIIEKLNIAQVSVNPNFPLCHSPLQDVASCLDDIERYKDIRDEKAKHSAGQFKPKGRSVPDVGADDALCDEAWLRS